MMFGSQNENRMKKLLATLRQLLRCPLEFPLEALMGLSFFVIAAYNTYHGFGSVPNKFLDEEILAFFVPLFVLTFYMHKVNKWAYVASFFIFPFLMPLSLEPFINSSAFPFTYVLAALLLIVGTRWLTDRPFGAHLLHVITQLAFGVLVTGILNLAILAIAWSFFYIFGIKEPHNFYLYIYAFLWFFVAPLVCVSFISHDEYEEGETPKILQIIINFILTPAIMIYTVILYAYTLKILFTWDLPKGGVAWMVMGFIVAALAGYLTQYILPRRYYDWFYRYFTWIALPPLVLYWVGTLYRIRLYSFTESRVYLFVAGVLMTLFVLMLLWRGKHRYQFMTILTILAIVVFTYIPGISAKSIGIACQQSRMQRFIERLQMKDPATGKFFKVFDVERIRKDSLLCAEYHEAVDVIEYVRSEVGREKFDSIHGALKLTAHEMVFNSPTDAQTRTLTYYADDLPQPIDLGDFNQSYHLGAFDGYTETVAGDLVFKLKKEKTRETVLVYNVSRTMRDNPQMQENPEQLLVFHNDSLLVLLSELHLTDNGKDVSSVGNYNLRVFGKKR